MTDHDVIVVGGGLIGAAAAVGLVRAGRRVLLVDRDQPGSVVGRFDMDIRNVACSPGSRSLLEGLGIWRHLTGAPYRKMSVWEEQGTAELSFEAREVGRGELGWILENGPTVDALWTVFRAADGASVAFGEVAGIREVADSVEVKVDAHAHRARLLVGVDGARSTVRALIGAEIVPEETGHQALATLVRTEHAHDGAAYQRFLLDGPLALLPSRERNISSVVWSQTPERARRRLDATDEAFCADLGGAIEHRLGAVLDVDRRLAFPLRQHVVSDFNPTDRVLLIGDAARVLHPLAGLGANVGFEDVRDLLSVVAELPPKTDLGSPGLWRAYARKRRTRARLMVGAMTGFKNLYAAGDPLFQWLRNSAIGWVNESKPIKRQLIREALGLGPLASTW